MMKAIQTRWQQFLFNKILPRANQYLHDPSFDFAFATEKTKLRNLGIYYKKNQKEKREGIVLLAHPYLADAKLYFTRSGHLEMYESLNYHVVLFDFNGFGQSPFLDFHFELDLIDIYRWTKIKFPNEKIILHGISFGAAQLIRAVAREGMPEARLIVENCLDQSIHYFLARNKKIYSFLQVVHVFFPWIKKEGDYVRQIQKIKGIREVAFIYGQHDVLTTLAMGRLLENKCPVPSRFFTYPGSHLKGIETAKSYRNFISSFVYYDIKS